MDKEWYKISKGLKIKEQWDLMYGLHLKTQKEGESIWGPGNYLKNSALLVELLPNLLKELEIKIFCDIGCGDFLWLSKLDWSNIKYIGYDIVKDLINENKKKFKNFNFECKNLIEDKIDYADMIFMRSVLIHTSLDNCKKILKNIKNSGSKYLMVSSQPHVENNIDTDCLWLKQRNLQIEPFNFPEPIYLIPEIKKDGLNNYMGIWKTCDIPDYEV